MRVGWKSWRGWGVGLLAAWALLAFGAAGLAQALPVGFAPSLEIRRTGVGAMMSMAAIGWRAWTR